MIRTILAYFGYCKIPLEAIKLSIEVESFLITLEKQIPKLSHITKRYLESQQALTEFLRSGRALK